MNGYLVLSEGWCKKASVEVIFILKDLDYVFSQFIFVCSFFFINEHFDQGNHILRLASFKDQWTSYILNFHQSPKDKNTCSQLKIHQGSARSGQFSTKHETLKHDTE